MRFLSLLAIALCLVLRPVKADVLRGYGLLPSAGAGASTSGHGCGKIMDKSTCEEFSTTCYWDFVNPGYNRTDDEARCFDKDDTTRRPTMSPTRAPSTPAVVNNENDQTRRPWPTGGCALFPGDDPPRSVVCGKIVDKSTCERFSDACYWDFDDPDYNRTDDKARCFDKEIDDNNNNNNNTSTAASLSPSPRPEPESDDVIIIGEDVVCERIMEKNTCENYSAMCYWEFVNLNSTRPDDEARCFDKNNDPRPRRPELINYTNYTGWAGMIDDVPPQRPPPEKSDDDVVIVHGMCGRIVEKSTCEEYSHMCYWDFVDSNYTRPDDDEARCFAKDICSFESSQSRSECNSIKGCSWHKGDGDNEARCAVAPSHQTCSAIAIQKRKKCEVAGCLFLKTKKRGKVVKECVGRREHYFLSKLKGKFETQARQALEKEFGKDTYTLVVVKKGKQAAARKKQWNRIRIHLKYGRIKKTPRFG